MLENRYGANRANSIERKKRSIAGFTMAELLIVVAIIGVLAAVSFIAVQAHQKSMTQLQYDAIAKEIFVAAQNHLTLAKSENYLGATQMGTLGTANADKTGGDDKTPASNEDVYYFKSTDFTVDGSSILDQMLPFGSVELVTGGSFIIRYQPKAARVLDVFYWTDDNKYGIASVDYAKAVDELRDNETSSKKSERAKYGGNGILGWCGGEGIVDSGKYLETPEIEVINKELLLVKVKDPNMGKTDLAPLLKLIVKGEKSEAKIAIPLTLTGTGRIVPIDNGKEYNVILDDITTDKMHFSDLKVESPFGTMTNGKDFVPGENITIQAVAYSNTVLTSVAYSGEWTTNSLFGEVKNAAAATLTADKVYIGNIRHLENLNDSLSDAAYKNAYFNNAISAVQMADLDWDEFKSEVNKRKGVAKETPIYIYDKTGSATKANCFLPVTVSDSYTLTYDGQNEVELTETGEGGETTKTTIKENHSIKGIRVDNTKDDSDAEGTNNANIQNGGVFGALKDAQISNLALINTSVKLVSGDVGTLVGKMTQSKVQATDVYNINNVVSYNTYDFETILKAEDETKTTVSSAAGNAGGLIGQAVGDYFKAQKSAAALIVNATGGNAGGLIGTAAGGIISGCYSGGHAIDDPKGSGAVVYNSESEKYNVTATATVAANGIAGGLIGNAGNAKIEYCYSTCSVEGSRVGGLVGNTSGRIENCYSTGLVSGLGTNPVCAAFAVVASDSTSATIINSKYFEIINELATIKRGSPATEMTVQMSKTVDGDDIESIWYMEPVKKSDGSVLNMEDDDKIIAIDYSATKYDEFCGSSTGWKPATPYEEQTKLNEYYGGKYNLQTVAQLDTKNTLKVVEQTTTTAGVTTPADFVATHHGDWPAPEIFVINTAS